jgi:ribosome-associated toxin RatA of RatAB toxin-antitoxin module
MPIINRSAIVPYSAEQMFQLVDDVERYPEFLPWCEKSEVHSRNDDEVHATLHLSWKGMTKSFSTCNRVQKGKMIEIRLAEGPFKQLEGFWRFTQLGDEGSKVSLDLEFEFSNMLIAIAFGKIFEQVSDKLVGAFCERAQQIYA